VKLILEKLIDALYEVVYEGSAELGRIPDEFKEDTFIGFTIKHLRSDLRHDLEHGEKKDIEKKIARAAEIYNRYVGRTALCAFKPEEFQKTQLLIMTELKTFLEDLKQYCINN
jgi:hypothetical protein